MIKGMRKDLIAPQVYRSHFLSLGYCLVLTSCSVAILWEYATIQYVSMCFVMWKQKFKGNSWIFEIDVQLHGNIGAIRLWDKDRQSSTI